MAYFVKLDSLPRHKILFQQSLTVMEDLYQKGITFIPQLAFYQLSEQQKELVRPFAIPHPTRQIVLVTNKSFVRYSLLRILKEAIQASVPKEMLSLQAVQYLV